MLLYKLSFALLILILLMTSISKAEEVPSKLNPPVVDGLWLRPSKELPSEPIIGFKDGIRLALWPIRHAPRGVIQVHAPFVHPGAQYPTINFIAIEPIVAGQRGFSELEHSPLDDHRGLRMWFSDKRMDPPVPSLPWNPSRGKTGKLRVGDKVVETLTVVLNVEKFINGAHVSVQVTFRSDRPDEVGFKVYPVKESAEMESCVITATMGNYSRTRLLWLKDALVDSRTIWPKYKGNDFVWTDEFPGERIRRENDGALIVAITPNETDLQAAKMSEGGWWFGGKVATQYWRKYPGTVVGNIRTRVNGRASYYGGHAPIPGGVSFENFELIESFKPRIESWFGITLSTPYAF